MQIKSSFYIIFLICFSIEISCKKITTQGNLSNCTNIWINKSTLHATCNEKKSRISLNKCLGSAANGLLKKGTHLSDHCFCSKKLTNKTVFQCFCKTLIFPSKNIKTTIDLRQIIKIAKNNKIWC